MPKFPPPPRTPQNRSGFSFSLAVTSSPSAVTRSIGEQVVDRRAVLAHQPADPTAERQAGDPGVRDDAADGGEPEELGLAVELSPQHACLGARRPGLRVDANAFHRRQVDHEPAVAERVTRRPRGHLSGPRRADHARVRSAPRRRRRRCRCSARCRPDGGRSRRSRSCDRCHSRCSPAAATRHAARPPTRRAPRSRAAVSGEHSWSSSAARCPLGSHAATVGPRPPCG